MIYTVLGFAGALIGAIVGVLTGPSYMGVKIPLGVLFSGTRADAPFKQELLSHLLMVSVIGLLLGLALAFIVSIMRSPRVDALAVPKNASTIFHSEKLASLKDRWDWRIGLLTLGIINTLSFVAAFAPTMIFYLATSGVGFSFFALMRDSYESLPSLVITGLVAQLVMFGLFTQIPRIYGKISQYISVPSVAKTTCAALVTLCAVTIWDYIVGPYRDLLVVSVSLNGDPDHIAELARYRYFSALITTFIVILFVFFWKVRGRRVAPSLA